MRTAFDGRVAVVTGAASGIGRALARRLARRGCNLALWDIRAAELDETVAGLEGGVRVTSAIVDVSDRAQVFAAAEAAIADHGAVDIVINNAGVAHFDPLRTVDFADFERVMAVNFWGVLYGVRAFLPHLETRPEASVVNIASVNSFAPFPSNGPYNCSKAAVASLNATLHMELADSPVQVLGVHPGGIDTHIVDYGTFGSVGHADVDHAALSRGFSRVARTSPDRAAARIIGAIRKKQRRLLVGLDAFALQAVHRLAPDTLGRLTAPVMKAVLPTD